MAQLILWFSENDGIALEKAYFQHGDYQARAIRGKTCGAYVGYSTFQWSPAVQALCLLLLKYMLATNDYQDSPGCLLLGGKGSAASSLDYALGKQPSWILDMFGVDCSGRCFARRLIPRTNPERKRPGPVALGINERILAREAVKVKVNEISVESAQELTRICTLLEKSWQMNSDEKDSKTELSELDVAA